MLADDQINRLNPGLAPSDTSLIDVRHIELVLPVGLHQIADGLHGIEILEDAVKVAGVSDILEPDGIGDGSPLKVVCMVEERTRSAVPRNRSEGIRDDGRLRSFRLIWC